MNCLLTAPPAPFPHIYSTNRRQDALVSATGENVTSEREVGGQLYYDVQIDSPDVQYLSVVTVNQGKVFALFVKSPTKAFKADEAMLRHVAETFKTI